MHLFKQIIEEFLEELNVPLLFDITKIPEEQLRKQYVNYEITSVPDHYGSPLIKNEKENYIVENKEISYPLIEVKKIMLKKYSLEDWQFKIVTNANKIEVALLIPNIVNNLKTIVSDMKQLGYFPGAKRNINSFNMRWMQVQFEPLYQKEENDELLKMPYLYHITPFYNLESIKNNGILPKHENKKFNYPDRIYLIKYTVTEEQLKHLAQQLCNTNNNPKNDGKYCILTINTKKLPENIKLFLDPNYELGCFTNETIPFNCVDYVDEIVLKK